MGGRGNVVPPASHPLPGGPPVGGGVLQAAVSARDQILGLAEGSETAQSLCGRQTSGGSADCRLVHRRRRQTKYILRITSFITNVENRVMRFFLFFIVQTLQLKILVSTNLLSYLLHLGDNFKIIRMQISLFN